MIPLAPGSTPSERAPRAKASEQGREEVRGAVADPQLWIAPLCWGERQHGALVVASQTPPSRDALPSLQALSRSLSHSDSADVSDIALSILGMRQSAESLEREVEEATQSAIALDKERQLLLERAESL